MVAWFGLILWGRSLSYALSTLWEYFGYERWCPANTNKVVARDSVLCKISLVRGKRHFVLLVLCWSVDFMRSVTLSKWQGKQLSGSSRSGSWDYFKDFNRTVGSNIGRSCRASLGQTLPIVTEDGASLTFVVWYSLCPERVSRQYFELFARMCGEQVSRVGISR